MPKKNQQINWSKVVKVALEQDKIVKTIFCARCVWLIGKLATKPNSKIKAVARQHYLKHVGDAVMILAEKDNKIVKFKNK